MTIWSSPSKVAVLSSTRPRKTERDREGEGTGGGGGWGEGGILEINVKAKLYREHCCCKGVVQNLKKGKDVKKKSMLATSGNKKLVRTLKINV